MILDVLSILVGIAALALLIPATTFFIECVASVFASNGQSSKSPVRPSGVSVAVLIPAHDEAKGIAATVHALQAQLESRDRLIVIADNCKDATATIAADAGAEVIERTNPVERGKGYAIAFGLRHLETDPPDVLMIVDADCTLTERSIDALTELAIRLDRPVQADYVSEALEPSVLSRVSAFAMLVRNRVRPLGLQVLGLPCHLMGTGMAFPWEMIRNAPGVGDELAEDLVMGIELAIAGHPCALCMQASVESELPTGQGDAIQQRRRWEHGHIGTLLRHGPRLVRAGLAQGRPALVFSGFDLMVPPLAMLVASLSLVSALGLVSFLLGGPASPLGIAVGALTLVGLGVIAGWARYGRNVLPFRYLLLAPLYVLWKVPLYLSFLLGRREREWKRTSRD